MAKLLRKQGPALPASSQSNIKHKYRLLLLAGCAIVIMGPVLARPAAAQFTCGKAGTYSGGFRSVTIPDDGARAGVAGAVACGTNANANMSNGSAFGSAANAPGLESTAIGANSVASGSYSTAVGGSFSAATGNSSTALGAFSRATCSVDCTAVGVGAKASAFASTAISRAEATGTHSTAIGYRAAAGGTNSDLTNAGTTAIGANAEAGATLAGQTNATAVGFNAAANNASASAFGNAAVANGVSSTALGANAAAAGNNSIAAGNSANAAGARSIAIGLNSSTFNSATDTGAVEAVALGRNATALANRSVAIGSGSLADAADVVSVGAVGAERRIINVRRAVDPTDAVNLAQVQGMISSAGASASLVAMSSPGPARLSDRRGGVPAEKPPSPRVRPPGANNQPAVDNPVAPGRGADAKLTDAASRAHANDRLASEAAMEDSEGLEPSTIIGWANVNVDGTVSSSRNISRNTRHGIGDYEIVFRKKSLLKCTYNATLGSNGLISVRPGTLANSLKVEVRTHNGVSTDSGFYLMAVC